MKQRALVAGGIVLGLIVLSKSGILDALMMFLLVGAVPGTSFSLPAGLMFGVFATVALAITFRFTAISLIDALDLRRLTLKHLARRERMPKRRFSGIPTRPQA